MCGKFFLKIVSSLGSYYGTPFMKKSPTVVPCLLRKESIVLFPQKLRAVVRNIELDVYQNHRWILNTWCWMKMDFSAKEQNKTRFMECYHLCTLKTCKRWHDTFYKGTYIWNTSGWHTSGKKEWGVEDEGVKWSKINEEGPGIDQGCCATDWRKEFIRLCESEGQKNKISWFLPAPHVKGT